MGASQLQQTMVYMLMVGFERRFALYNAQDEHPE
jgi:hypothetical protein